MLHPDVEGRKNPSSVAWRLSLAAQNESESQVMDVPDKQGRYTPEKIFFLDLLSNKSNLIDCYLVCPLGVIIAQHLQTELQSSSGS